MECVLKKRKSVVEILHDQKLFNDVRGFITWANSYLFEPQKENTEKTFCEIARKLEPIVGYEALNKLLNYSVLADELYCSTLLRYACAETEEDQIPKEWEDKVKYILKGLLPRLHDHDVIRVCSECGHMMTAGYIFDEGADYYCGDNCLNKQDSSWIRENLEDESLYYTEWF